MKTFSTPISSTNSQTGAIGWYTEDSRTPSVVHYPVQEIVQCSNGDLIHTSTGSFGQKDAQGKVQWTRVQPEGIPS